MDTRLLGLPVVEAAAILRSEGVEPVITITRAPRDERQGGVLRVIRVSGSELTCAAFHEIPKQNDA